MTKRNLVNVPNKHLWMFAKRNMVSLNPEFEIPLYSNDLHHVDCVLKKSTMNMKDKTDHFLGYQCNSKLPEFDKNLQDIINIAMNNVGDPFCESTYGTSCKGIEKAVMDYCALLWKDDPYSFNNPDQDTNYWGFVTNMGSTEGNLNGLWNERKYLLSPDKLPITLFSDETHYSVAQSCTNLQLQCKKLKLLI